MEWKTLTEHIEQGLSGKAVQSSMEGAEKAKKKRSQAEKYGRHRWNQDLLKRVLDTQERIECELRWVRHKLDRLGEADYSKEDVERFAVLDAVDKEILQRLLEVGVDGALPKDLAAEVNRRGGYSLKYYDVARRLVRLNKKLQYETGKLLSEKRVKRWALSRFAFEVYGASLVDDPAASDSGVAELSEEENL
jgi:hypothetical protein